jgi:hypothetical protein
MPHIRTTLLLIAAPAALALAAHNHMISGQPSDVIRVGPDVHVSSGLDRPLSEPHMAAHPANGNHLLAATIVGGPPGKPRTDDWWQDLRCSAFLSTDGGKTWQRHDFEVIGCGDPWVGIAPDGNAVFTALGTTKSLGDQHNLVVFHSPDGGKTWDSLPVGLGRGHDHQTVIIDGSSARTRGSVYILSGKGSRADDGKLRWTVFVARSMDGGKTFLEPVKVYPSNLNLNTELGAVFSDGTLLVSYRDFQRNVNDFRSGGILDRSRGWVLTSLDGGQNFSIPLFMSELCGGGWTYLAVDSAASSPFRDRLYHTCNSSDRRKLYLYTSSDRGEKWSDAIPITTTTDTTVKLGPVQVAVNKNAVVGVSWIESRTTGGRHCETMQFSASLDGGKTFVPAKRVGAGTSCPDSVRNGASFSRWATGGDYYGLVAAADGRFHLYWSDSRSGIFQNYSAAVEVSGRGVKPPDQK